MISPYLLDVAVFGTQEASQQLHDIIFELIILQPGEQKKQNKTKQNRSFIPECVSSVSSFSLLGHGA